ncbi:Imm50 family immunity protein [uncultured Roseobacter sp.]|uniref:Imm50 family immunity protein n=1 Tax=uncultured Roseobacter sp. TaxID=114847 RepID=UPI0026096963|nr:Imm50 family immunity protein [uncultured Roseobacter sp.]
MEQDHAASIYELIPGGKELLDWFGKVPSFHDAEIIDLFLRRNGASTLRIHAWNMTNKVQGRYFILEKHAVVEFSIARIVYLELDGFNHQNAIEGLKLSRMDSAKYGKDHDVFELLIEPAYGMAGLFHAQEISVSFRPGKPE